MKSTGKYIVGPQQQRTSPFVWCAAIVCTILTVAVIIVGFVVFVGYIVIHPRVPFISVTAARLDQFQFDQSGVLVTRMFINIHAENDNAKAHAAFQDMSFVLSYAGLSIARLMVADPFVVKKNSSVDFPYVVESSPIPLDPEMMDKVSESIRMNEMSFDLKGSSRAQWRVGPLGSIKFRCNLDCRLHFHPSNGTFSGTNRCSSRSK
ncbi:hypothetical protein MLD38_037682 [Melastoma candidum]|uniref:Uncharacterized protein n=1 Tax=Melastoma candidum TaxID=119954 RepID=A0ACB9LNR7_9MYRT|nr:hypothetical protein MLD38_037682 [Melastoma candidum]